MHEHDLYVDKFHTIFLSDLLTEFSVSSLPTGWPNLSFGLSRITPSLSGKNWNIRRSSLPCSRNHDYNINFEISRIFRWLLRFKLCLTNLKSSFSSIYYPSSISIVVIKLCLRFFLSISLNPPSFTSLTLSISLFLYLSISLSLSIILSRQLKLVQWELSTC